MKIKNNGSTIISIGTTVILPDETAEILDERYNDNEAINRLVEMGILEITKEKPADKPAEKKPTTRKKTEKTSEQE